jgi:hypothetical protein
MIPRSLGLATAALGCTVAAGADPGTRQDRALLFDYIVQATMERTAFSPFKPRDLGLGGHATEAEYVRSAMWTQRESFLAADTDAKLYHALTRLTCARWDGHLSRVRLVEGGLQPFAGLGRTGGAAPIKFKPDYGDRKAMFLFVSDFARDIERLRGQRASRAPAIGDKLVGVNGQPAELHLERLGAFVGKSTHLAHWWDLAYRVTVRSRHLAPELFDGEHVTYALETRGGVRYTLTLPYLDEETIEWAGHDDQYTAGELADRIRADPDFVRKSHQLRLSLERYRGFRYVFSRPAFDLYAASSEKVLLLQGHRFVPETMTADLDHLMEYARAQGLLDHAVIYDLTRGGGGDFEEYTLQRLQPRPFRIMFGNLRISSITPTLVQQIRAAAAKTAGDRQPEEALRARDVDQPDPGRHLIDWLDRDVAAAIRAEQAYTSDVPFKSQFLPASSNGYLYPVRDHFRGPMVLLTAPSACSGADQFAAMFIDNGLGLSVGMPEGGCSNTWEWDEVLKFPISGKPVTTFSWNVGHSIRPNGEVLEGNPAVPSVLVPLTRDNYGEYYDVLLGHALRYIRARRGSAERPPTMLEKLTQPPR